MARRVRPGPVRSRTASPRSRTEPTRSRAVPAGEENPHRGRQVLVWALVLMVFCGLAFLSGQAENFGSQGETAKAAASAAPVASAASTGPDAEGRVLAGPEQWDGDDAKISACKEYNEKRDFLPLNRWTSFELFVVDNSWIFKTQLFVSMIASLMFMAAAVAWRIIGILMSFSYTFDMICSAAPSINAVGRSMSLYASWFLIPGWLFVLMAAVRRWTSGKKNGPASAMRLMMVFLAATGMIFFIGDQSDKNRNNPTGRYTLPWMAATVQGWVGTASTSLYNLQDIGRLEGNGRRNPVFYDDDPARAGKVTCAALDDALYAKYEADNADTELHDGRQAMMQLSKIWETTLVRSWETAQFGEGTREYPSSAHAACRLLEAHSDVGTQSKLAAYDLSTGNEPGTTKRYMYRGYYIDPADDEQIITVAWAACKGNDNGIGSGGVIPQWKDAELGDTKKACDGLYSNTSTLNNPLSMFFSPKMNVRYFYFNGRDEMRDKLGKCVSTKDSCHYSWEFVSAWLGKNQADRLTQGLMSMIVSFIFLFVLGPMAIGQAVSSVALAGLVMILPLTLLGLGLGLPQGKRLLKLTGAAAAGDFYFTLALTMLTMFIDTTYGAISETVGTNSPNFFEQVAQGISPLVALYLFRRLSKILGMGDLSTTTGAVGFAGAAVLRTSGDQRLSRNADRRMSGTLGRLGAGRMRLGALDERSLQRRMLDNAATRSVAGMAGRGVKRAARPLTDWTKDKYEAGRAGLLSGVQALQRKAASGSPGQRAAAYAGLTAGMAGLTVLAPPSVLATLPLMAFTGGAAALRGGQATGNRVSAWYHGRGGDGDGEPGLGQYSAAGIPMAKSARSSLREADDWHRNIIRVGDSEDQRKLMAAHAVNGLEALLALQSGTGLDEELNANFAGFVSEQEKDQALRDTAAKTGLKPEHLMMGDHGLALPKPVMVDKRSGQRVFAPGTSIEQASHPVHYLDRYTLQRQTVDGVEENDDQYIARLTTQLHERGYVTDSGEAVDVFAAHGFDTRVPEVRERVAAFISGSRDEELSKIIITARRSEDAAVRASQTWVDGQIGERVKLRAVVALNALNDYAGQEIADLRNNKVEMPDGTSGTVGQLEVHLEQTITKMMSVVAQAQDLHDARSRTADDVFSQELDRLTRLYQEGAQNLDRMSAQFRDAVDATTAARGVCELQVKRDDPNIVMDTTELSRMAERLTSEFQQGQRDWHEAIDRLAGAVSRPPGNAADARGAAAALDDLRDTIARTVSSERRENRQMIQSIEDVQRTLDNNARMTKIDPRSTADRPIDVRKLLREMYRRELSRK